jgi:hypothetical protein
MIVSSPSQANDAADPSTRLDRKVIVGCRAVWRIALRVLWISARSASLSGLTPPVPFRTSNESASNLHGHRGVGRGGRVDGGATMPAGDLDGEIVAGLGAQPCPGRLDQEPAQLGSEPVGTGDPHGRRLRRRRNACCPRGGPNLDGRSRGHRSRHWALTMVAPRTCQAPLWVGGRVRPAVDVRPRDRKVAYYPWWRGAGLHLVEASQTFSAT